MSLTGFLAGPFCRLFHYRKVLVATSLAELKATYAGSALGLVWVWLGPFILLVLYSIVYAAIFRVQPQSMTIAEYILYMFSGLVPLMAFSSALTSGAGSLSRNRQYLLNTVFPAELLPVRSLLVASASLPIGIGFIVLGDVLFSSPSWTLLLLPLLFVAQMLFTCGIVWVLSLLTLAVSDIQHMLQYVTIVLLIITPIGYTPDMIPSNLKILMYGNPLFYYVASYQDFIIFNKLPSIFVVVTGLFMSLAVFWTGYLIFQHAKTTFYEYA